MLVYFFLETENKTLVRMEKVRGMPSIKTSIKSAALLRDASIFFLFCMLVIMLLLRSVFFVVRIYQESLLQVVWGELQSEFTCRKVQPSGSDEVMYKSHYFSLGENCEE